MFVKNKSNKSIAMSNIQIESDLKEILQELKDGQKAILEKVNAIDLRLTKVETKLDEGITPKLDTLSEQIKEIKGSQQAQIWTLIGILITAVTGFLIAVGRFVISGNP
jgi:glycyl-tRNA synthetase (class II)